MRSGQKWVLFFVVWCGLSINGFYSAACADDSLPWVNNGWTVTTAANGLSSATTSLCGRQEGQTTTLNLTLDCTAGQVTFGYTKFSADDIFAADSFYIDGVQQSLSYGPEGTTVNVTAGTHSFSWQFNVMADTATASWGWGCGTVTIQDIVFPSTPPTTTATPAPGTFSSPQSVTLASDTSAAVYYTTDGSTPTKSSPIYNGPIDITANTTLKYFAMSSRGQEAVKTANYTFGTTTTATPAGGNYFAPQTVTLTANGPADIFYTTDGSTPTTASTAYSGPFTVSTTTTLRFFSLGSYGQEQVKSVNYLFPVRSSSLAFDPPVQIPLPYPAWSIATADYNLDGKADLAVANYNQNSVTAYLGNGNGTFAADKTIGVGSQPTGVAFGVVNGNDALLDIAAVNSGSGTVSLLTSNGSNLFSNPVTVGPIPGTTSVAVGHFHYTGPPYFTWGGPPDLAIINNSTGYLNILYGQGGGVFNGGPSYYVGLGVMSVVMGDFNRDYREDLAVVNYDTGQVTIFTGTGNGYFDYGNSYPSPSYARSISTGDVNGDGRSDLLVVSDGDTGSGTATIFLGNGDGTFQQASQFQQPQFTSAAAVADFNGDGLTDLALANRSSSTLSMLFQSVSLGVPVLSNPASPVYYATVQAALSDSHDGNVLQLTAGDLYEDLSLDKEVNVTVKGGFTGSFGSMTGSTTLHGTLTINSGTLVVENLIIV